MEHLGETTSLDDGNIREIERIFDTKPPLTGQMVGGDGKKVYFTLVLGVPLMIENSHVP